MTIILRFFSAGWGSVLVMALFLLGACNLPEPPKASHDIPADYANKHMPKGWWNGDVIVDEGRLLYLGQKKADVNCAQCHGKDGKPVRSGARDFRNASAMKEYSDSHLLWRISEGVSFSQMRGYKDKLSEEEIWKIIAYIGNLELKGLEYDPDSKSWIPSPA